MPRSRRRSVDLSAMIIEEMEGQLTLAAPEAEDAPTDELASVKRLVLVIVDVKIMVEVAEMDDDEPVTAPMLLLLGGTAEALALLEAGVDWAPAALEDWLEPTAGVV